MQPTRTTPRERVPRALHETLQPTLTLVHHVDPARLGVRRVLSAAAPLELGRQPRSALPGIFDDDELVSRSHARIFSRDGRYVIADLGSRNGTFVNGRAVDQAALDSGDVIGIGRALLLFHESPARFQLPRDPALVGVSRAIADVLAQVATVAPHPTTVAIIGETGVGKELVAERIHALSGRSGALVPVNCGGLPDGLIASELFGHVRGAFTGAERARRGLIETARGGTLFLDEITDASPGLQAHLLRLLETNAYRPVGADQELDADVRYVVAVQPRVHERLRDGTFRLDLWTRLTSWEIDVPPLRQRPEDVCLLAATFAERLRGRPALIDRSLALALLRYAWPGNVRELKSVIERLVLEHADGDELTQTPWLVRRLRAEPSPPQAPTAPASPLADPPAPASLARRRPHTPRPPAPVLAALVAEHRGNVRAIARALGVDRKTLYRWLEGYAIDPGTHRN